MGTATSCVVKSRNALSEGPIWDPVDQFIYWVDILGPAIWRCDAVGNDVRKWDVPAHIGSLALRSCGGAVTVLRDGFYFFDFETRICTLIAEREANNERTRFNDGKTDRRGRFIAGTMDEQASDALGCLYQLDTNLDCRTLHTGSIISNGPCWSPDNQIFYFSDSVRGVIYRCSYDIGNGSIGPVQILIPDGAAPGKPDGCTIDSEGFLWSVRWGGSCIARFAPDASLDRIIEVPMRCPTSCTFGGPDLNHLYITSMPTPTDFPGPEFDDELAGDLVVISNIGVTGLPEQRFDG